MARAPSVSASRKLFSGGDPLLFLFYPAEKKILLSTISQHLTDKSRVMAKNKGKPTSKVSQTDKIQDGESKTTTGEDFISLDAGALANLTRNIEQKLKGDNNTSNKTQKRADKPNTGPKKEAVKGNTDKKGASQKAQNTNQGKKRNRDGEVIDSPIKGGKADDESTDDILRREILALGGSKEDFDLLAAVDSDSEVEESTTGQSKKTGSDEGSLRKELAKLLKDAGQFNPEIADDQVSEAEMSVGEEDDEEEDDDEELVETNSKEVKHEDVNSIPLGSRSSGVAEVADQQTKHSVTETQSQFPKEYSKLVSSFTATVCQMSR